jgi:heme exporter protein C
MQPLGLAAVSFHWRSRPELHARLGYTCAAANPNIDEKAVSRLRFMLTATSQSTFLGINWFKYSSPQTFYPLAGKLAPWFAASAAVLGVAGLYIGFFVAPTDAQQGESYRIIFIHVPAAWMSMFIYMVMAFWAGVGLAFNTRLSHMMAKALAPTGAMFTFVALWTGALWGKPTWGAWWVWDARLTSELLLLFLYFGFIGLQAAIDDPRRADKAGAVLALVGVINIPIIYYSVRWWNTLHQGASVSLKSAPTMAKTMLIGMLVMVFACWAYAIAVSLWRVRCIILERERRADWVRDFLGSKR